MSEATPLLSLIVVAYREGPLLERALESARAQLDGRTELLLVKSASDCNSTERVCSEAERLGVNVLWLEDNRGLSFARNAGVARAKGKWVCFLDGDDELPPGALARILAGIEQFPEADFLFGDYDIHHVESGEVSTYAAKDFCGADGRLDSARAVHSWMLSGHGPVRREVFGRNGGFRQRFSFGYQDVDFYFRLLLAGGMGHYIGGPLYRWNRSTEGMNARRAGAWRFHRASSWRAYEFVGGDGNAYEKAVSPFLADVDGLSLAQISWLCLDLRPNTLRRARTYLAFLRSALRGVFGRMLHSPRRRPKAHD